MILESAVLYVAVDDVPAFEESFRKASKIIASIDGYIDHQLQRCIEVEGKYLLLVTWETLEAHTVNFRQSDVYGDWKALLHHFYDPFPVVEHFVEVELGEPDV